MGKEAAMRWDKFVTDKAKEIGGVWYDVGEGFRLLVARDGNPSYLKAAREQYKLHEQALKGPGRDELAERIQADVVSRTILLGWEGLENEEGKAIDYSPDTACACLIQSHDFAKLVDSIANRQELYRAEKAEAAGKA
jgi:hypothetical protein